MVSHMDGFSGTGLACVRSNRIVFAGLDFAVSPGGALVLSGPNGSGKSSLLRLMAGIARPAAGNISWQDTPISEDPEMFFARMHYVGHRDAVKPALTVRENLSFHAALRPGPTDIDAALDRVDLAALADLPARMLSTGQTRRLTLARILATPAPLWLLDEPTIALDYRAVDRLRGAIDDHRAGGGIIVASTNVPLGIDDATTIDLAAHAPEIDALWGDESTGEPAEDVL
jgi:heme exporter protein A